jgi:hypothetical protein
LQILIREIGNCFRGGGKQRGGLHPPHGKNEREPNGLGLPRFCWDHHSKFCNITVINSEPVESVGDINLRQVYWSKARIRQMNRTKDSPQGSAKLHGFGGC